MAASHCALSGLTGKFATGVFNTLSGGNTSQLVAPGNGVPADATPDMPPIVRPKHSIGVATSAATIGLFIRRLTNEPSCVDGSAPGGR